MRKVDVTSPTVANDSVFLTAVIAAFEGRKVKTTDIPCAFPQVTLPDEDNKVLMTLQGPLAELMALSACTELPLSNYLFPKKKVNDREAEKLFPYCS